MEFASLFLKSPFLQGFVDETTYAPWFTPVKKLESYHKLKKNLFSSLMEYAERISFSNALPVLVI